MIEVAFEALTGLRFSLSSIIGLIAFYAAGALFGRLTKNVGILKILIAAIVAYYGFTLLANASGAFIVAFVIGVATNHISFTMEAIYWAEDIGDLIYALKHPEAFKDIRDSERQRFDQAEDRNYSKSGTQKNSGTDKRSNTENARIHSKTDKQYSNPYAAYYRTLGLNPEQTYTNDELKKAYRKQALKTHPDIGGSSEAFKRLGEAYYWLLERV